MSERNYAADNFITAFSNAQWPQAFDNVTGITSFQRQLYWQMLGQALWVKSDIEGRRAQNTWGTITWQVSCWGLGPAKAPPLSSPRRNDSHSHKRDTPCLPPQTPRALKFNEIWPTGGAS